jgi:glycosyltransferase involved in cell wall biosynthesis
MEPLVSIIVPVYNAEKYLKTCVDSLCRQTYRHLEILLLDDSSQDQSLAICHQLAAEDDRIRVFHHENIGSAATRNRGIDEAKGEYIVFCDNDDIMEPDAVETMLTAAGQQNAQLVIGAYGRFNNDEKTDFSSHRITRFSMAILDGPQDIALLFTQSGTSLAAVSIWAKLYETRIIRENNVHFPEGVNYEEDCCFNLQYYRHVQRGVALRQLVYHYRQIPTSLSKVYRRDQLDDMLRGYKLRCELLKELDMADKLPMLKGVMQIVFENRCKRIALSGMSKKDKRTAYTDLAANETVQEIVQTMPLPRQRLCRLVNRFLRMNSVPLLSALMGIWLARRKLKKG